MSDLLKVFVLLAIGAVISNIVKVAAKPEGAGFFQRANAALSWAMGNIYDKNADAW